MLMRKTRDTKHIFPFKDSAIVDFYDAQLVWHIEESKKKRFLEVIKSALTPKGSFTEAWKTVTADATRTIFHISKDKHSQVMLGWRTVERCSH
jgi:hypothetical protein